MTLIFGGGLFMTSFLLYNLSVEKSILKMNFLYKRSNRKCFVWVRGVGGDWLAMKNQKKNFSKKKEK